MRYETWILWALEYLSTQVKQSNFAQEEESEGEEKRRV